MNNRWRATGGGRAVAALLTASTFAILTGCSNMTESNGLGYTPEVRDVLSARAEAKQISSQLLNLMALNGKTMDTVPGVGLCGEEDPDHVYVIRHPWSLYGVPVEDMKKAMARLQVELPHHGWDVVSYGPDSSPAKSLEIIANSTKTKFSVNITLLDERNSKGNAPSASEVSLIYVTLVSACFRVPEGKTTNDR